MTSLKETSIEIMLSMSCKLLAIVLKTKTHQNVNHSKEHCESN